MFLTLYCLHYTAAFSYYVHGMCLFQFRHTNTERTHESCKAFIKGMFGNDSVSVHVPPPIPNDPMLHVSIDIHF